MKSQRNSKIKSIAYFLTVIALLSAILTYMNTVTMGFPDGHLTEFELAVKPLYIGYSILGLLFGILFMGLARFSNDRFSQQIFYVVLCLFILVAIGVAILYFYFGANLNHGGGG